MANIFGSRRSVSACPMMIFARESNLPLPSSMTPTSVRLGCMRSRLGNAGSRKGRLKLRSSVRKLLQVCKALQTMRTPFSSRPLLRTFSSVRLSLPDRARVNCCLRQSSLPKKLSASLSVFKVVAMPTSRPRPSPASSKSSPTSLLVRSRPVSSAFDSSHIARLPCERRRDFSVAKFQNGRCLPSSAPKRIDAMRHVLFMKGSLRKMAADSSESQPSHLPSAASLKRYCAKRPS